MTNRESMKDMTSKFDKLDKFEGQDFRRWQKKMHFLLTTLKVVYVLSTPSPVWSENETLEATRKRMKWEKDDYICRGHILNSMSDSLFDIYQNVESAKALWESLESKYMAEDASAKKFLEGLRNQELDNNPKGKNQIGSSSVNMVEGDGVKNSKNNKNKRKFKSGDDKFANKKGTMTCWKCNKPGHMKKDCRSLYCYVYLLHAKHEALDKFKIYKQEVELQRQDLIKVLRTDRGGEYYDPVYFQSTGIIHQTTAPYTPQQNGVAERKNRTLKEMVNSMLSYSGLSEGFWGEAMLTACYILNRTPNKNSKQTPYEIWTKKVPNLTYLRVWGCRAVVRLTEPKMKNLGEKGIDCIFIGYAEHSKCYRFYVIEPNDYVSVNSIIESRDAMFDEERFTSIPRPRGMIQPSSSKIAEDEVEGTDDVPGPSVPRKSTRTRKAKSNKFAYKVDDMLIFGTDQDQVNKTKEFLSSNFDMKDLGEAEERQCLSLEISRAIDFLKWYAMISTRPDIDFAVGKLSSGYPSVIEGYSDASWINNMEDHSSTSAGNEAEWLRNLIYEIPLWPKLMSTISIRLLKVIGVIILDKLSWYRCPKEKHKPKPNKALLLEVQFRELRIQGTKRSVGSFTEASCCQSRRRMSKRKHKPLPNKTLLLEVQFRELRIHGTNKEVWDLLQKLHTESLDLVRVTTIEISKHVGGDESKLPDWSTKFKEGVVEAIRAASTGTIIKFCAGTTKPTSGTIKPSAGKHKHGEVQIHAPFL
ncbi:zinc finger, CCHC-type containing protein [Tanacetum coccineum]